MLTLGNNSVTTTGVIASATDQKGDVTIAVVLSQVIQQLSANNNITTKDCYCCFRN